MEFNNSLYLTSDESVTFDPFYRYQVKLPVFERKGKLVYFSNIESFAKSIEITPNKLLRIIGLSLSCSVKLEKIGHLSNVGIFNTDKSIDEIKSKLYMFIQKYICCSSCDKPEIFYSSKKVKCRACGSSFILDRDDKFHKIMIM